MRLARRLMASMLVWAVFIAGVKTLVLALPFRAVAGFAILVLPGIVAAALFLVALIAIAAGITHGVHEYRRIAARRPS